MNIIMNELIHALNTNGFMNDHSLVKDSFGNPGFDEKQREEGEMKKETWTSSLKDPLQDKAVIHQNWKLGITHLQ